MPNGLPWTKEGFAALEAFFTRLEPSLTQFATARNVAIERYYHDAPSWDFLFRHPRGGVGKVELWRVDENATRIERVWWKDDYDEGVRYLRSESQPPTTMSAEEIGHALSRALDDVLAWDPGTLTPRGGMRDIWHRTFDEKTFREQELRYPVPRPSE